LCEYNCSRLEIPCKKQTDTEYYKEYIKCDPKYSTWIETSNDPAECEGYCEGAPIRECNEQPEFQKLEAECTQHKGALWVVTNSNPERCEGFCHLPPPCKEQTDSYYYEEWVKCDLKTNTWIDVDTDPFNCKGYCKPPRIECEEQEWFQQRKDDCTVRMNGLWIVTNSDPYNCNGYCEPSPLPCNKQVESDYYQQMEECKLDGYYWVTTNDDPEDCQGICHIGDTTSNPSTSTKDLPLPCNKQVESDYYQHMEECKLVGYYWVTTNDDPENCQGTCRIGRTTSDPSTSTKDLPLPCNKQVESDYYQHMEECKLVGYYWVTTNDDPENCQGTCRIGRTTSDPSTSTTTLAPCNQQVGTPYWYEMMQCGESITNPGVWVETSSDPTNCEGYCNRVEDLPFSCNIEQLMEDCDTMSTKTSKCIFNVTDTKNCKGECVS
jgi:hypothetical protein